MAWLWCDRCGNHKCTCARDAGRTAERRAGAQPVASLAKTVSQERRGEWTDAHGVLLLIVIGVLMWLWHVYGPSDSGASSPDGRSTQEKCAEQIAADGGYDPHNAVHRLCIAEMAK
jgi:hypothetical protein